MVGQAPARGASLTRISPSKLGDFLFSFNPERAGAPLLAQGTLGYCGRGDARFPPSRVYEIVALINDKAGHLWVKTASAARADDLLPCYEECWVISLRHYLI